MGKLLIVLGVALIIAGLFASYVDKIPFLGKLPGDFHIQRKNFNLFFPLGSSIVLSIILTVLINVLLKK